MYQIIFCCSGTLKNDETSKTKLTRRIGIKMVIMKKLCKQEVIGMNASVNGLNAVHLICDSHFNI